MTWVHRGGLEGLYYARNFWIYKKISGFDLIGQFLLLNIYVKKYNYRVKRRFFESMKRL